MPAPKKASLAHAIKQSRPFASIEQEAYLSILRTAFEMSHAAEQFLKQFDITQAQYNVLRILRGAGEEGLGRNEIAARMVTPMPDVSRLLDRMEKMSWISRRRGCEDRRQMVTCITVAGLHLLDRLARPIEEYHRKQFEHMSSKEVRHLVRLLEKVRERG